MVVKYNVFGRQIAASWLSIATLAVTFGGTALMMGGKKAETTTPPINAKSSDEEKFIKDFLANVDAEEKKAQKAAH